jgi:hypothetical protein
MQAAIPPAFYGNSPYRARVTQVSSKGRARHDERGLTERNDSQPSHLDQFATSYFSVLSRKR